MEQRDVPCPRDVAICSQSDWIELDRCVLLRSSEVNIMCGGVRIVASRLSWCVFLDVKVHICHQFFYHRHKFLITVMFHFYID